VNKGNTFKSARYLSLAILISTTLTSYGQQTDSLAVDKFSIHAQTTSILQFKPSFPVNYTGRNSLIPEKEAKQSFTGTLFLGARLWKGASIFINPEVAAGSGLSCSLGVAASTNGESYRIDNPAPSFDIARLFFRQIIALSERTVYQSDDANRLGGKIPDKYLSFTIGKISVTDYFDNNSYSHDPRTQFMSWALMSNGAWDFPANTRGYTPSLVLEYVTPRSEIRYGFSLVPTSANGMQMNWRVKEAGSHTLEYTHPFILLGKNGSLRLLSFCTIANMGNYNQSLDLPSTTPDIIATERSGRVKYGFGINLEQELNDYLGSFVRASWNDGETETWAFTEIDRSISMGLCANGAHWNRKNDRLGWAVVTSGLSTPHRNYLKAGGMGFELGDGNLNYGCEHLSELYYSMGVFKGIYISETYQLLIHPGYNRDRGPVQVFSMRLHVVI